MFNDTTPDPTPADLPKRRLTAGQLAMLAGFAARSLPPGTRYNLRARTETVRAARQAENPVVGRRFFETKLETEQQVFYTEAGVHKANNAHRYVKRVNRQRRMAHKRTRGWA